MGQGIGPFVPIYEAKNIFQTQRPQLRINTVQLSRTRMTSVNTRKR